ncbi:hypothetical protein SAMD00019534_078480 [Acytostelium subglobosum LB1]|uniref:hypothetical protein n=1 Tax=Acytostelium subglobosum LB1 TaxID=1410327 RepID=UPI0006451100|nr:hypothetical protein SAMD00019534_078480 [Acytostelium subglobosum LB1]GAM24673.1 hypothetical protein SAMD00019534_078480 [Acytostelium subglobosum LB1]|eukprot:XP_012752342.1 hypothetical protein SAMD00019534_078480 [Acytostelium subglobosum LB1]
MSSSASPPPPPAPPAPPTPPASATQQAPTAPITVLSFFPPVPVVNVPLQIAYAEKSARRHDSYTRLDRAQLDNIKLFIDDVEIVDTETGIATQQSTKHKSSSPFHSISKWLHGGKDHHSGSDASRETPLVVALDNAIFVPTVAHEGKRLRATFTIRKKPFELAATIMYRTSRTLINSEGFTDNDASEVEGKNTTLRIIQYNIMADCYTSAQRYTDCPPYTLYRPYRQWILPEYVNEHHADILCMQEAEVRLTRLREKLAEWGYAHTTLSDLSKYQEEQSTLGTSRL